MGDEIEIAWQQLFKLVHNEYVQEKRRGADTTAILAMRDSLHWWLEILKNHRLKQFDEMEATEVKGFEITE